MNNNNPNDPYASALLEEDPYQAAKIGEIPKTEGFLQKIIRSSAYKKESAFQRGFQDVESLGASNLGRYAADQFINKVLGQASDRKSTRLNSSHIQKSRMPSSA